MYLHYPELNSRIDDHCFFQQVLHSPCWLCSHFEPTLDFRCLQLCLVLDGIIPAQFLQRPAVALVPGIHGHDPVERELLPSETLEAKLQVTHAMPSMSASEASSHAATEYAFRTTISRSTTYPHGRFNHRHGSSHSHPCVRILLRRGTRMSAHVPPRRATAAASSLASYVPRFRTSHASAWPCVRPSSSATHLHHTCPGERGRRGAQRRGHLRPVRSRALLRRARVKATRTRTQAAHPSSPSRGPVERQEKEKPGFETEPSDSERRGARGSELGARPAEDEKVGTIPLRVMGDSRINVSEGGGRRKQHGEGQLGAVYTSPNEPHK